jgi:hypothetical protein
LRTGQRLLGETPTIDKMQRRVQYDLDYLDNWSRWLDFKIFGKDCDDRDSRPQRLLDRLQPALIVARRGIRSKKCRPECNGFHNRETRDVTRLKCLHSEFAAPPPQTLQHIVDPEFPAILLRFSASSRLRPHEILVLPSVAC